jgi:hypothetical protein
MYDAAANSRLADGTSYLWELLVALIKHQAEVFEARDLLQIIHISRLSTSRRFDLAHLWSDVLRIN